MTDNAHPHHDSANATRACSQSDLVDDGAIRVTLDGTPIAIATVDGEVFAIDDTCSHADYSLSDGDLDPIECALECPKHGSLFSLRTGEALTLPATIGVATYPVEIRDGEVLVTLPNPDRDTNEASK